MFEIDLFICIKMDLALIAYNGWCAIKTKPNQNRQSYMFTITFARNKIINDSSQELLPLACLLDMIRFRSKDCLKKIEKQSNPKVMTFFL